jgi:hypothetical protein
MRAEASEEIAVASAAARFKGQVARADWDDQPENANRRALRVECLLRHSILQEFGQLDDGLVRDERTRCGAGDRDQRKGGEKTRSEFRRTGVGEET